MLSALLFVAAQTIAGDSAAGQLPRERLHSSPAPVAIAVGSRWRWSSGSGPVGAVENDAMEAIADIRVHGNAVTSDEEVIQLAGITIGAPVEPDTLRQVEERLYATRRFQHVEVLKRFASIADPTQILLVIIVDEGPLKLQTDGSTVRIVRSRGPHVLFLPVLDYEDGYGLTYGGRFAFPDPAGGRSRLSFPLTWGGDKQAGAALEKRFERAAITRVVADASISRRTNPFYHEDDDRVRVSVRGERELGRSMSIGATGSWNHAAFLDQRQQFVDGGVDFVVDTRLDPMLARNAVYARVEWDHLDVLNGSAANRSEVEGRGYVGLIGQSILVVRAVRDSSDRPLPPYLQPLLGGMDNLRGFEPGYAVGDNLVAGSTELRVPVSSPLGLGKFGVSAFVDAGTAYPAGERLRDQTLARGVGGGVWFSATVLRLNLAVAHGIGASTHVHFGTTLTF